MYFKKIIHPEYFQGNKKKTNYFEGWYYKCVSPDGLYTLAFIPGISMNSSDPHAFVQLFISHDLEIETKLSSYYFRYDVKEFTYGHDDFFVKIGNNYFSKEKIDIELINNELNVFGSLKISHITPINHSIFTPNIMGFFGYFNFMECYHGIVSMTHQLSGLLTINQQEIMFNDGKGYIEKDWGKSFPRAYVWLQSNHFKNPKTSLMFSYADIPFLGFYFKGLIVNLHYENREYRFATYNFAKVKVETIEPRTVRYIIKKGCYTLDIEAHSTNEIELASPRNGQMIEQIKEGLSGTISVKLYKKKELIYEDIGLHSGIEIMK